MEQIYPITEERIKPLCGNIVCVVLEDGTRHVGILSACRGGKLILNSEDADSGQVSHEYQKQEGPGDHHSKLNKIKQHKSKPRYGTKHKGKSSVNAIPQTGQTVAQPLGYGPGPFYPFGPVLAIDLALIAFLFLLL